MLRLLSKSLAATLLIASALASAPDECF